MAEIDNDLPYFHEPGEPAQRLIVLCDHARHALPSGYGDLGLSPAALERHIAYDIGAEAVSRALAAHCGADLIGACYSRLLIDPNRGADDPTLIMRLSDGTIVPGNASHDREEREHRLARYWQPYRNACARVIDAKLAQGMIPALISIHTFTPCWRGAMRPWHVGILWDTDNRLAGPLLRALALENDLCVGDNEPYDGALAGDTLYEHATRRGLPGALIEIRQDLVAQPEQAIAWGARLSALLRPILARPETQAISIHPSRADAARKGCG